MYDQGVSLADRIGPRPYSLSMSVSAHDVAAVLRQRLPSLGVTKLHKLLYYCQGHHLATFGVPLFNETISAWDNGPVVGNLWYRENQREQLPEPQPLGEAELNTIGYVISRYGSLTATDLVNLTHSETPWQTADKVRRTGERVTIRTAWIREFFSSASAEQEDEMPLLDSEAVTTWLRDADTRRREGEQPDDLAAFRARLGNSG